MGKVSQLAQEMFARALRTTNLKVQTYGVMAVLAYEGPHAQRELSEKLAIDRSTMVGLIDELEALGLVVRARDPKDRRRHDVTLTDVGREAVVEAQGIADSVQEAVFGVLDKGQRRHLREMLVSVLHNIDERS